MVLFQWKGLLDEFEKWFAQDADKADSTARMYRGKIDLMCTALGHPAHWKKDEVIEWYRGLLNKQAERTVNTKVAALRAFSRFLSEKGIRDDELGELARYRKVPKRLPQPVQESVIDDITEALDKIEDEDERMQARALFELLYGSGLRRTEAACLQLGNVESRDVLTIIGKGDKERKTLLTDEGFAAIKNWVLREETFENTLSDERLESVRDLRFWELRDENPSTPVFYDVYGNPVRDHQDPGHWVYRITKSLGDIAPHKLRHTWTTELLAAGADSMLVQNAGGWEDARVMQGYVQSLNKGVRKVKSFHPRQKGKL